MVKRRSKHACGLCGADPAEGFADINGVRYCHGDDEAPGGTCYERANLSTAVHAQHRQKSRWTYAL